MPKNYSLMLHNDLHKFPGGDEILNFIKDFDLYEELTLIDYSLKIPLIKLEFDLSRNFNTNFLSKEIREKMKDFKCFNIEVEQLYVFTYHRSFIRRKELRGRVLKITYSK